MLNAIYFEVLNLQQDKQQETLVPMVGATSGHCELLFQYIFAIVVS